jgi:hypothetical protein
LFPLRDGWVFKAWGNNVDSIEIPASFFFLQRESEKEQREREREREGEKRKGKGFIIVLPFFYFLPFPLFPSCSVFVQEQIK